MDKQFQRSGENGILMGLVPNQMTVFPLKRYMDLSLEVLSLPSSGASNSHQEFSVHPLSISHHCGSSLSTSAHLYNDVTLSLSTFVHLPMGVTFHMSTIVYLHNHMTVSLSSFVHLPFDVTFHLSTIFHLHSDVTVSCPLTSIF